MWNRILLAVAVAACSRTALAQPWTNGTDINNTNIGRVGVGVSPATRAKFQVYTGTDNAIFAETAAGNGFSALYGSISNSFNASAAVFGWSNGKGGVGVYGQAHNSAGNGFGVWGDSFAHFGYGVVGQALDNTSGAAGIGVYARSDSPSGYALYAFGTGRNYLSGDTGIGQPTPAAKLHVTGSVRFDTLANGAGTPLVVDASGNVLKEVANAVTSTGSKEFRLPGINPGWTVPAGVSRLHIRMWGGGGGSTGGATGGSGGYLEGSFFVSPGSVFTFTVGTGGNAGASGLATTFVFPSGCTFSAGGGGGASGSTAGAQGSASIADSSPSPPVCVGSSFSFVTAPGLDGVVGINTFVPASYPGPIDTGTSLAVGSSGFNSTRASHGAVIIDW